MRKCNVCGRRFRLLAKNRYEVVKSPVGLNCLTEGTVYFNAFDCPHCGCQNIVGAFEKEKVRDIEEQLQESEGAGMNKSTLVIDTPKTCGDCPFCIFTAEEKNYIGYCHTSDDDYYCKMLQRFMEYDKVDGGVDILGKPKDCPLQSERRNE